MKLLKKLLLVLGILLAIVLLAAAFVKKDYRVERSIVIQQPNARVFAVLKSLKRQHEWSAWGRRDPNMQMSFRGTDGTVGFVSQWKGNAQVGEGEQEIKQIIEGQRIENELRIQFMGQSKDKAIFITEPADSGSTKITWILEGNMAYPFNLMGLFFSMNELVGKDFEEGLSNLKQMMEAGKI